MLDNETIATSGTPEAERTRILSLLGLATFWWVGLNLGLFVLRIPPDVMWFPQVFVFPGVIGLFIGARVGRAVLWEGAVAVAAAGFLGGVIVTEILFAAFAIQGAMGSVDDLGVVWLVIWPIIIAMSAAPVGAVGVYLGSSGRPLPTRFAAWRFWRHVGFGALVAPLALLAVIMAPGTIRTWQEDRAWEEARAARLAQSDPAASSANAAAHSGPGASAAAEAEGAAMDPRELSTLRRELSTMVQGQALHFRKNGGRYAAEIEELRWYWPFAHSEITWAEADGWAGRARSATVECRVYVGEVPEEHRPRVEGGVAAPTLPACSSREVDS
jgi:hypothetical protein